MRSSVKLARYMEKDSRVHSLDPRAKLIAMIIYFVLIITVDSLYGLAFIAAVSYLVMAQSNIPFRLYVCALKPLRYLIAFIFLFPFVFGDGGLLDNAAHAAVTAGRMTLFVMFTAILTFTTRTTHLTQGLESLLAPFRRLGMSPEKWSLMLNLALRFLPTIIAEAQIILKAQASRGADYAERSWKDKAKILITLLVPVTVGTFRRAQELTDSMEARGFVPGMPRTLFHELSWGARETWFIIGFVLTLAVAAALRVWV